MALAFRPRIGPFIYIPNTGPGLVSKLIALTLCLGLVWPVQIGWVLIKLTVIGCVHLTRLAQREINKRSAKHRA